MQADRESNSGPPAEFNTWVRPHLLNMHRFAIRLVGSGEAEDLTQVALTRAWQKWSAFDPEKGSPQAWLLAIVADQSRKHRRFAERPVFDRAVDIGLTDRGDDLDIERAIASLAERQRLAVTLFYTLDLSLNDVAAAMGCAPGTVKATLNQARGRLRELLGDDHE